MSETTSTSEWVTIRVTVSYGWVGAEEQDEIEFRRSEWDATSKADQDEIIQEHIQTMIANRVSSGWDVLDDEEDEG